MKKQYQKATLPGHRREMGVRDSAAEAMETANPAKPGETAPPNQSPDNNTPVTQAEFREATFITRSEFKEEISNVKAELKEDIHDTKVELNKDISDAKAELNKSISDTKTELNKNISDVKIELKEDIHKLERRLLWATLSATGGLALLVIGAMLQ